MKSWHLSAALAVACAWLIFRVIGLQGQLDEVVERIGDDETPPAAVEKAEVVIDHSGRIDQLERDQARLREELALLEDRTESKADYEDIDYGVSEDRILSVVTREAERIRDRQLEFQRSQWIEHRESALERFVGDYDLSESQERQIRHLLKVEIDSMMALLKGEDARENPEQAASDWAAILMDTDRQARQLLDPDQVAAWDQGRFIERRVLWPFLPEPLE